MCCVGVMERFVYCGVNIVWLILCGIENEVFSLLGGFL